MLLLDSKRQGGLCPTWTRAVTDLSFTWWVFMGLFSVEKVHHSWWTHAHIYVAQVVPASTRKNLECWGTKFFVALMEPIAWMNNWMKISRTDKCKDSQQKDGFWAHDYQKRLLWVIGLRVFIYSCSHVMGGSNLPESENIQTTCSFIFEQKKS